MSAHCQRHFSNLKCSWCWIASSYVTLDVHADVTVKPTFIQPKTCTGLHHVMQSHKFDLKKLETMPYRTVLTYLQTIISFCHNPHVWQTDRQTDRQKGDNDTLLQWS